MQGHATTARNRALAFMTALASIGTGCNLPVPRSVRVACCPKSPVPKLGSVKPGTTVDSLRSLVGQFETEASQDHFFWARWYRRTSPIGWMGTTGQEPGSQDEFLEWKLANLVATSDDRGIVQRVRACPEHRLLRCLDDAAAALQGPAPTSAEQRFRASRDAQLQLVGFKDRYEGDLILHRDGAMLHGKVPNSGEAFDRTFPLTSISEVNLLYGSGQFEIHLKAHLKPDIGLDWVEFQASPAETWELVKLLHGVVPLK